LPAARTWQRAVVAVGRCRRPAVVTTDEATEDGVSDLRQVTRSRATPVRGPRPPSRSAAVPPPRLAEARVVLGGAGRPATGAPGQRGRPGLRRGGPVSL